MKLFKKFLAAVLSFGMLFSAVGTAVPSNLDKCCTELDRILSQEEKDAIKSGLTYYRGGYVYNMVRHGLLGVMIRDNLIAYS